MLKEREINFELKKAILNKGMYPWLFLRIVSSFGPLIVTYIFAEGIAAIEHGKPYELVLKIFLSLALVEVLEHLLRVASKAKIAYFTEGSMIQIQEDLVDTINPSEKHRKEVIQTLRNLTQSARKFVEFMYNNGVQGLISFVSVPIILYFVEIRVFYAIMILMFIYMVLTFYFSKLYEKYYEAYNAARERYFAELLAKNAVTRQANVILKKFIGIKRVFFLDWFSLQTLITIFTLAITVIVVKDIYLGLMEISDLVLIIGYVKESKGFLNNTTGAINHYMEVKAGVERVSVASKGEGLALHKA